MLFNHGQRTVDADPTGNQVGVHPRGAVRFGDGFEQRGLPRTTDRIKQVALAGVQGELVVAINRLVFSIAQLQIVDLQDHVLPRSRGCQWPGLHFLGQRGVLLVGGQPVISRVVGRSYVAQHRENFWSQNQDGQPNGQLHVPAHEAQPDEHRDHGHREGGDQFEPEAGEEHRFEVVHGGFAVPLAQRRDSVALRLRTAQPEESW